MGGKTESTNKSGDSSTAASSASRPPGVPAPDADPADLKALEEATGRLQALKAQGQKPGDADFDKALTLMKSLKEKVGIRDPTKAEKKAMEKAAKASKK